jgi:hypothetical protein
MENNELTIVISNRSTTVSLLYHGQKYTEQWSRTGNGHNFHMESNRDQVEIPDKLTQSIDPKFLTAMMDTLNEY